MPPGGLQAVTGCIVSHRFQVPVKAVLSRGYALATPKEDDEGLLHDVLDFRLERPAKLSPKVHEKPPPQAKQLGRGDRSPPGGP
jgi:hypothetical protein